MAYTPVRTVQTGDSWTARDVNVYIRDNFAAGIPDLFTTKGDIAAATGADAAARVAAGINGSALIADSGQSAGMNFKVGRYPALSIINTGDLTNGSTTVIQGSTETFDPDGVLTVAGDWKYTAPATGYYLIGANLHISGFNSFQSLNQNMLTAIFLVGATVKSKLTGPINQGLIYDDMVTNNAVDIIQLTAGDELKISVYLEATGPSIGGLDGLSYAFAKYLGA